MSSAAAAGTQRRLTLNFCVGECQRRRQWRSGCLVQRERERAAQTTATTVDVDRHGVLG